MGYLESDLAAGYPKIWLELQANDGIGRTGSAFRADPALPARQ